MGVPKFFRWLSERYPKINQRFGSTPNLETCERYFGRPPPPPLEYPDPLSTCGLPPEVDRLYLDMNGIIHGCSHNNNVEDDETTDGTSGGESRQPTETNMISREEIFRNVCYFLDRIVGDIVQPNHLVYMAIDGVAPRAKLNQQRSRRYRSGLEGQIETTIYEAHAQKLAEEERRLAEERELLIGGRSDMTMTTEASPFSMDDGFSFVFQGEDTENRASARSPSGGEHLQEVSPGRFKGKFKATTNAPNDTKSKGENGSDEQFFHSNVITPGTPFFQEFTRHLEHFVRYKVSTDPKWKKLTIIFSGPNVPGEGEHKLMDFIRAEKKRPGYNPNWRHCIMGQDGDLIMLGLATHEPNLVLLRERVVFNTARRRLATKYFSSSKLDDDDSLKSTSSLDSYLHNSHFEFLHMGVLRDYLAFEFETSNVLSTSPFDLEHTIDDFVFMTFFVGNDFLPHMPALDIADNAFDLLFLTYKQRRAQWLREDREKVELMPYLTNAGNITSGRRLEEFLTAVGGHEGAYYDKKRQAAPTEQRRIERVFKKFGMESNVPDASLVASKEESDRAAYRKMLLQEQTQIVEGNRIQEFGAGGPSSMDESRGTNHETTNSNNIFSPVVTNREFQPAAESSSNDEYDDGLISRMGSLLQNSLSSNQGSDLSSSKWKAIGMDDQDLKGRYYYDKFQLTPFDEEKHLALRKAYVEGLVWNLKYYYEGCASWEWFFPYHYGPMLSDLVNLDEILKDISFEGKLGTPLKPFEQLMGCMPPSQAHTLPKPYRKFLTDPDSPIIDFYPQSFTIDMNGKRWPWEAVTLLPFIDSKRLLAASATIDEADLTEEERARNAFGEALVIAHDPDHRETLEHVGATEGFQKIENCTAKVTKISDSTIQYRTDEKCVLEPKLVPGVVFPLPGYGSLRDAPVQSLWRRKLGVDVFSSRSRYKTACLELSSMMPPLPPIEALAPKLIGTIVFINYPYFMEGFVTAVSDESCMIRGHAEPRKWPDGGALWRQRRDGITRQLLTGEGLTGTGGLMIPGDQEVTLSVRPFENIVTTKDGKEAKSYAKFEVEVPLISTFWNPSHPDPRLELPSKLEKNRFEIAEVEFKYGTTPRTRSGRLFPPRNMSPVKIQAASFSHATSIGSTKRMFSCSAYAAETIGAAGGTGMLHDWSGMKIRSIARKSLSTGRVCLVPFGVVAASSLFVLSQSAP